jgi:serine/threonine protein kinase
VALAPGTRLGPYEVIAQIGAGGMGEVYRARDTKLNRDVALKILPDAFTLDGDRIARFRREAQVLAALNHPNIAAIYGFEDSGNTHALVLELVEGPTLADRIAKGPFPLDEALPIAKQIAEALEAAHEQGIIHRDLKPANITVRDDGTVKVLDFGLAKLADPAVATAGAAPNVTASPTITTPAMMTSVGVILGTAAYMSPEQAKGQPADKRSDIWAFGCVLYEMLAGKRAFEGQDVSDTLAGVLRGTPNWEALPAGVSPVVRMLLTRCLSKERRGRIAEAASISFVLEGGQSGTFAGVQHDQNQRRFSTGVVWSTVFLLMVALLAGVVSYSRLTEAVRSPAETRLELTTPLTSRPESFAISPDGRRIVYVADQDGNAKLWLRDLDGFPRVLPLSDGAYLPFWSPDNRNVAFFVNRQLRRIDVETGDVRPLSTLGRGSGGTWNQDGTILFGLARSQSPIYRIEATGGLPTAVTRVESARVSSHYFPQFLPDGRHFLFYAVSTVPGLQGVYMATLDSPNQARLLDADSAALFASGHLLFIRGGRFLAQSFDPGRGQVVGEPQLVAEHVPIKNRAPAVSASQSGTLLFRSNLAIRPIQLTWFDRSGAQTHLADIPNANSGIALAPNGHRAAFSQAGNVHLIDLTSGVTSRFTFNQGENIFPVWSPDGESIVFGSAGNSPRAVYRKAIGGNTKEEQLLALPSTALVPLDWFKRFLLVRRLQDLNVDIAVWDLMRDRKLPPVAQIKATSGQFSPDGKWVAYESEESGTADIYITPFPDGRAVFSVSSGGGSHPRWQRDGKAVFYIAPDGRLTVASVSLDSLKNTVTVFERRALFAIHAQENANSPPYVVTKDGNHFLVMTESEDASPLNVVLNWMPSRTSPK